MFRSSIRARFAACLLTAAALAAGEAAAASCSAPPPFSYGDPPATLKHDLDGLAGLASLCVAERGQAMNWSDGNGSRRRACLIAPPGFTPATPLPLLVWLHPSLFPQDSVVLSGFLRDQSTADLTGDPARRGYQLLLVEGRDTTHYYPVPDNTGLGWDNWYRNFNRASPALNVDAATVDHFIESTRQQGGVDPKRVYLSGWSNGAAFAQLYALNTPGIAAAAVYSSPDPFADSHDPCPQAPFASNRAVALMDIHNACDIIGICTSGSAFHRRLAQIYPGLAQRPVIISEVLTEAQSCVAACSNPNELVTLGTLNHLRWPTNWNIPMFEFLRDHALP